MAEEAKNYITPGGYRRLQEELARLWKVERPPIVATVAWAAGNGDRSENGDYISICRRVSIAPWSWTIRARRTSGSISAPP
jgi:hypothetical protein